MTSLRTRARKPYDPPYPPMFDRAIRNRAVDSLIRIRQVTRTFAYAEDVHSYVDWDKMSNDLEDIIRQLRDGLEEVDE